MQAWLMKLAVQAISSAVCSDALCISVQAHQ
jgi:hypothetical protein